MASPTPFSLSGTLSYPPDEGEATAPRSFGCQLTFQHEIKYKYELSGSGTKTVNFGSIDTNGAKCILIEVDPGASVQPVFIQFNGGGADGQLQVSAGGGIAYWNPVPDTDGVLSMVIVYASSATVRVTILG